jgi:hypothetical protein
MAITWFANVHMLRHHVRSMYFLLFFFHTNILDKYNCVKIRLEHYVPLNDHYYKKYS